MKNQVIIIHGGDAFDNKDQYYAYLKDKPYDPFDKTKRWKDWIETKLSDTYDVFAPQMPNAQNADYLSWKIWFEKIFPYLNQEKIILIGHSLGGVFLAKWLSENEFPKKVNQLYLVAAVFDDQGIHGRETIGDFLLDPTKLSSIESKVDQICIYHSKDDPVVDYSHAEKYKKLLEKAELISFEDRGHFRQEEFPELLEKICAQ